MMTEVGSLEARDRGTPQGGVISPLLANLYLQEATESVSPLVERLHDLTSAPKSRVTGDCHARFREGLGVKLPLPVCRLCVILRINVFRGAWLRFGGTWIEKVPLGGFRVRLARWRMAMDRFDSLRSRLEGQRKSGI